MLSESIKKLVQYGVESGITPECERIYTTNLLLDVFSEDECSKKYQTEVTEMKKIMLLLSKVTCIMAMALAVLSVNSTCGFTAYQPDVPESLEHD